MLRLSRVSKTFNPGTVNAQRALDDISLTLEGGEFLVVVGGNGSGKSTLLNAVAGVFPVDAGHIHVNGEDVTALPEHKRARYIGRVFQDPMQGTAANMSIEENLGLAFRRGKRRGLAPGVARRERDAYREALSQLGLGLENRLSVKAGLLSGGQRQALTLLMATLERPHVLLLDEHTAALDPKTAKRILALSAELVAKARLTALMVTHNMKDALLLGDRLIMIQDGRVTFEASGEAKAALTVSDLMDRFSACEEETARLSG